MKLLKIAGLVMATLLVLLMVAGSWLWSEIQTPRNIGSVTAPPRGDAVLSDFYRQPANLPERPGTLIRQEALQGPATLAKAESNIRILYSSTDGLDGRTISGVSGAVYLPIGDVPDAGWPLLVWSHGTVGIGDKCAPSYAGHGARDPAYLNPWLEQGYAIAASDYQGLGTPGTHPYMDARTMAFNNLDLIRAVQSGGFPVSDAIIIAGQSQGATGALAAASYADQYAPDVKPDGIIATGVPYFSQGVMWDLVVNSDRNEVSASLPLSLYMLTFAEMLDPDFQMETLLSDKAKPVASKVNDSCVFEFIEASQNAALSSANTFLGRPEIALLKVLRRAGLPNLDFQTPVFTGSGTSDEITPFSMQQAFIADACAAGARVVARTYGGANHNEGLLRSILDAQQFARTVRSGGNVETTCPR